MYPEEQLNQMYKDAFDHDFSAEPAEVCGLISYIRTLQQQNKQLIEGMEYYSQFGLGGQDAYDWDIGEHAREVLKSLQGGTSNGTS